VRIATGAFRSSPVVSLHALCGLKPVEYYRDAKLINYYMRLRINQGHPMHGVSLTDLDVVEEDELIEFKPAKRPFPLRAKVLIHSYDIDLDHIIAEPPMEIPPWTILNIVTCQEMYQFKKSICSSAQLRVQFRDHLTDHEQSFVIYTDGSKTSDGVGYAAVGENVDISRRIQPFASIFTAELSAIYDSLGICDHVPQESITIITDSKSAIQSINNYNNNNPLVQNIQSRISALNKPVHLCWVPAHVGVPGNEQADTAARDVITASDIQDIPIPRSDFKALVKSKTKHRWKEKWEAIDSNKLREITDSTKLLPNVTSPNREWERALTRLRVGHSRLTHGYLMEGGNPPECDICILPLTIKHILTECNKYIPERMATFNRLNPSMEYILKECDTAYNGKVHNFIRSMNILHNL
jgi:ribonuclease HI